MERGNENENGEQERPPGKIWHHSTLQKAFQAVGRRFCYSSSDLAPYTRKIFREKHRSETYDLHRGNLRPDENAENSRAWQMKFYLRFHAGIIWMHDSCHYKGNSNLSVRHRQYQVSGLPGRCCWRMFGSPHFDQERVINYSFIGT